MAAKLMGAVNRDNLVVGGCFDWIETWGLRKAIIGPAYPLLAARRVSFWMLGPPLLSATVAVLQWICGRPWIWGDPAAFLEIHAAFLVLGGIIGLGIEFIPRAVTVSKDEVFIIMNYRMFWRLLLSRKTLVRVTPVAPQITRMDFYTQGRAKPKMVRACPFEAAKVVEWFQKAGINVELESG